MPAAMSRYAFVLCLLYAVESQDRSLLVFSENPVYNGSKVTLSCRYAKQLSLSSVAVDAFNGTQRVGSLYCRTYNVTTDGTGLFSGRNFTGCPQVISYSGTVNLSMDASPSLELTYNCSIRASASSQFYNFSSDSARLQVRVLPSVPELLPNNLTVNESDSIALECRSSHGVPPAHVKLSVSNQHGILNTSEGNDSVSLNVSVPRNWHNAIAVCNVTNHPFMAKNLFIAVNHIAIDSEPRVSYSSYASEVVLNCSARIAVYPSATYMWSIPDGLISNYSSLRSDTFRVNQGHSGAFNCTATNIVTSRNVLVAFNVNNARHSAPPQTPQYAYDLFIWALPILGFFILILIVLLCVLYQRGIFQKGHLKKPSCMTGPSHPLSDSGCDQDGEVAMTQNIIYDAFESQPSDDVQNTHHGGGSFSRYEGRLLVAAEGTAANLKHKILPTTVLVEFADRSCSLDDILAKIGQVTSSQSPTSFKSVALLLRSCEVGVLISEVDRAVLTSARLLGAKGEPLRDFFTRLADTCLDRQDSSGRIDILNYSNSDASKLANRLMDFIKVHVTVTGDLFGIDQSMQNKGENIAVGDDYFDRSRLADVVYADLEPLVGRKHFSPRRNDDQVLYSDVALKA